jgi:protein-S-isoprenylcysteine O-methyltransferase Ste14
VAATTPVSALRLLGTLAYLVAWAGSVLVLGGDARWLAGWVFAGWFVALCLTTVVYLYVRDPALLAERYRRPGTGGQSEWDQVWVYATALGFLAWMAAMPLDAARFAWSPPLPIAARAFGGTLLLLAGFFLFRALRDNTFASPLVRIQKEREQRLVSTGVYAIVRHPMYLGAALMFFGGPLWLGSLVGLAIAAAMTLLLAARIRQEERVLVRGLPGYADYQRKVRYRLVPFVW